jgi:CheY-specific phosphatase CheX
MSSQTILSEEAIANAVCECTAQALETMFYFGVLGPAEMPAEAFDYCFSIDFGGTCSGRFSLGIQAHAAQLLAANFLGVDDASADTEATAGELANILCGAILSALHHHSLIRLGMPQRVAEPAFEGFSMAFELEEGFLAIGLRFD